ncbi:MFS transporter [Dactylosporangium sp. CA-092794]|uniref:MFS transporter n=1 Tax=Dactylosporangium sp. CA-092794 TaxID=3239929 RepID=UPI003D8D1B7D
MSIATALGRRFAWLWAAYAVSTYGTWLGFGAFSFIAITALGAGAAQVSLLSACGLAAGAILAVPLGPWVEFRRKRPVLIAMDLIRFLAMASIPVAYWLGVLTFAQLVAVSVIAAAAKIAFGAASGVYLKTVVSPGDLLTANGRLESTTWSATVVGPTLGGAAIGLLGPVTTVAADAASYLLSALGIAAIGGAEEPPPARRGRLGFGDLIEGWRYILRHSTLRPLFLNVLAVNALIMAAEPPLSFLMLGRLGFPAWQYGLAFAVPCIGGLVGSRLARRAVARYGRWTVLRVVGVARACWPLGLAFIRPGIPGLLIVMATELGLIACSSLFNPVLATYRLEATDPARLTRVLSAWSVTTSAAIAVCTTAWGILSEVTTPRIAIAAAGLLLLGTPLLLPRHDRAVVATAEAVAATTP